jgi:hypothetical protein
MSINYPTVSEIRKWEKDEWGWFVNPNNGDNVKIGDYVKLGDWVKTNRVINVGPLGSRNKITAYCVDIDYISCGCWNGTLAEFEKRVKEVYPDGQHHDEYLAVIQMFKGVRK